MISVLTIFHQLSVNECKRECVSRIAKTLLYYTNTHTMDESLATVECSDILNFIHRATSPETTETYMSKMMVRETNPSTTPTTILSPKRKRVTNGNNHSYPSIKRTIEPVLVELQTILSIPRIRTAIRLVQSIDASTHT